MHRHGGEFLMGDAEDESLLFEPFQGFRHNWPLLPLVLLPFSTLTNETRQLENRDLVKEERISLEVSKCEMGERDANERFHCPQLRICCLRVSGRGPSTGTREFCVVTCFFAALRTAKSADYSRVVGFQPP